MQSINYLNLIASPLTPVLNQLLLSDHKISFTCSDFKENLIKVSSNEAYYKDENGVEHPVEKREMLSSFYQNYILTFYLARNNLKKESIGILCKLITYTCKIHMKMHEVVNPDKVTEFIDSFNSILSEISNESNEELQEILIAYVRIHKNEDMF